MIIYFCVFFFFFGIMTRFELTDITASDEPWQRCQKCAWVWVFFLDFICVGIYLIHNDRWMDGRVRWAGFWVWERKGLDLVTQGMDLCS